ncbi:MAG: hypothetical protein WCK99_13485, partial [Mycobacteriaceae bacterium]
RAAGQEGEDQGEALSFDLGPVEALSFDLGPVEALSFDLGPVEALSFDLGPVEALSFAAAAGCPVWAAGVPAHGWLR